MRELIVAVTTMLVLTTGRVSQAQSEVDLGTASFLPEYVQEKIGNTLRVSYTIPFVQGLRAGKTLRGNEPDYSEKAAILSFDFKLTNTTTQIKYLSSIIFDVKDSEIVNEDIPYLQDKRWRTVSGGNVGWASLEDLHASYALAPIERCSSDIVIPTDLRAIVPDKRKNEFDGREYFNWRIEQADVPVGWNIDLSKSGGPNLFACVLGYLDYRANSQSKRRPFAVQVWLTGNPVYPWVGLAGIYDVCLEAGRKRYVHAVPIDISIKPNSPERFQLRFLSNRSASFKYDVRGNFTDGTKLALGTVEMNYFRPTGFPPGNFRMQGSKNPEECSKY